MVGQGTLGWDRAHYGGTQSTLGGTEHIKVGQDTLGWDRAH